MKTVRSYISIFFSHVYQVSRSFIAAMGLLTPCWTLVTILLWINLILCSRVALLIPPPPLLCFMRQQSDLELGSNCGVMHKSFSTFPEYLNSWTWFSWSCSELAQLGTGSTLWRDSKLTNYVCYFIPVFRIFKFLFYFLQTRQKVECISLVISNIWSHSLWLCQRIFQCWMHLMQT